MSEDLYAKVDLTKKVRFQTADKEDTNADNNGNIDNVTIYDNYCAEGSTPPKSPDNGTDDQQQTTSVNVSSGQRNLFKAAAVFLGLLCLVLLAAVIVLVVLCIAGIQEKNNWRVSNEKLTLKTSELESMINNLTNETDKLQTSYRESKNLNHNLTLKTSELEAMINNLTNETDKLQTSYRESKSLNDNLTLKISELEAMNNNLTNETDKLKSFLGELGWVYFSGSLYYNLSKEKKTWQHSRDDCQQRGADLVIVNSKEEQEFISSYKRHWIGLTDRDRDTDRRKWEWVDGTPLHSNTSFWNDGEPNGASRGEDCVEIWSNNSDKNWNDASCENNEKSWICEKRLP